MSLTISGLRVYTKEAVLENAMVTIENGVIKHIGVDLPVDHVSLQFPDNYHLIPGFIDLHVHGINGHDIMDGTTDAIAEIAKNLVAEGTTSFLATTMTADSQQIEKALTALAHFNNIPKSADLLGVHLEGPFISHAKMGAQNGEKILPVDIYLMHQWQKLSGNKIRLITLAPELPQSVGFIEYLKTQNIISAIGHTNASYAETCAAIKAGCTYATHLFNAMRGIHHREPGAVTALLLADTIMAELIVDGLHLHPAIVELALKVKSFDKIILVTDAMRAKCMPEGCYDLGGQQVHVKENQARLSDGTLAGSVLTMIDAIHNVMSFVDCELHDVIKLVSENPAKTLGVFQRKGSIDISKDADLLVLDEQYNIVLTICRGEICFQKKSLKEAYNNRC